MDPSSYEPKCGTCEEKPISCGSIVAVPFLTGETLSLKRETDEDAVCSAAVSNKASSNCVENDMNPKVNQPSDKNKAPKNCEECGKRFATIFKLRKHFFTHHIEEPRFSCDQCGRKFIERKGMSRHEQMVHQGKLHMCPYEGCDRPGYKCPKALKAHIRSVHTNVRTYVCEICGKTFVRGSDRSSHLLMHGEKQFQCQCGKKFRRPMYLRNHRRKCPLPPVDNNSEQLDETKAIAMIMNSHSIC